MNENVWEKQIIKLALNIAFIQISDDYFFKKYFLISLLDYSRIYKKIIGKKHSFKKYTTINTFLFFYCKFAI